MPIKLNDLLLQEGKIIITFHDLTTTTGTVFLNIKFPRQPDTEVMADLETVHQAFGDRSRERIPFVDLQCWIYLAPGHNCRAIAQRVVDCLRDDHNFKVELHDYRTPTGDRNVIVKSFV